MKLNEIKKKFKNEWVLVEIIREDKKGTPTEIKLLEHSKNRDDTYSAMKKYINKYTYHFYTGKIPKKNYAVAF